MILIRCALVILTSALGILPAFAEKPAACKTVHARGAGFLLLCDDTLRLWNLEATDPQWQAGRDLHGRFAFECTLVASKIPGGKGVYDLLRSMAPTGELPKCPNQPVVSGFFIAPGDWESSEKNENAILAALRHAPLNGAVWSPELLSSGERITCEAFDAKVGDLSGRAACVTAKGMNGSAIVFVASDSDTGVVLFVQKDDVALVQLKDIFKDIASRLKVVRASGDAALLRWLQ